MNKKLYALVDETLGGDELVIRMAEMTEENLNSLKKDANYYWEHLTQSETKNRVIEVRVVNMVEVDGELELDYNNTDYDVIYSLGR